MSSRATRGAAQWWRNSLDASRSNALAGRAQGPAAPPEWEPHLRQLIEMSRTDVSPPPWWTPMNAYFGSVESRTDPRSYHWDGMKRLDRRDPPLAFFQLTLAGWGNFELYDHPPERMTPGRAFVALVPSRHRYYLPAGSPGWTFAWIGIYHPYWVMNDSLFARQISKPASTDSRYQSGVTPTPRVLASSRKGSRSRSSTGWELGCRR